MKARSDDGRLHTPGVPEGSRRWAVRGNPLTPSLHPRQRRRAESQASAQHHLDPRERPRLDRVGLLWQHVQRDASPRRTGPRGHAIRRGNFKLTEFFDTGEIELYNLADDRSEQHNLAGTMPGRARDLLDTLHDGQHQAEAKTSATGEDL